MTVVLGTGDSTDAASVFSIITDASEGKPGQFYYKKNSFIEKCATPYFGFASGLQKERKLCFF